MNSSLSLISKKYKQTFFGGFICRSKLNTLNRKRKVAFFKIWMPQSCNIHQTSILNNVIMYVDGLKTNCTTLF